MECGKKCVTLLEVLDYLNEVPKRFELGELESVVERGGRACTRSALSSMLNRLPNYVKKVERKWVCVDGKKGLRHVYVKLGVC